MVSVACRVDADEDTDLLTIGQAAKFLKIRPATIRRWVSQGLPTVRIGIRKVRIRRTILVAMLTRSALRTAGSPHSLPAGWHFIRGGQHT